MKHINVGGVAELPEREKLQWLRLYYDSGFLATFRIGGHVKDFSREDSASAD